MISPDVYLQPDAPDPVLASEVVLDYARRHLPNASAVTAVDESGGEARAYAIDDMAILKTQRPHRLRPRTSLRKEVFYLNQIAAAAPDLSVPRVLGYGDEDGIEYLLMSRMPGAAIGRVAPRGAARQAVFVALGQMLRRLHSLPLEPFEFSGLVPGDRRPEDVQLRIEPVARQAAERIISVAPALASELRLPDLMVNLLDGEPIDGHRAPLHSNPGPDHVFLDPRSMRFMGLIDFGDSYLSHPGLDLRRWTAPEDRAALLEGYAAGGQLDKAFVRTLYIVQCATMLETIAQVGARQVLALEELRALIAELGSTTS